ncbi:MAG TPA: xanthine dehydrogenase family protein subunit M [Anaerolineae bacterium]|jgi:carbon-monoxide dehydrogenase medium subunit|nr:xanthine dehydrogenase family protein subunit M [Anaerolineae bacterium]
MKPAPFEYYAPATADEALARLAEHGWDAKVLAGGQSLVPLMNFRLSQPAVIVDLNNVSQLFYIRPDDGGGLRLGAMTRQHTLEHHPLISERSPLLHETIPNIAYPQIRSRGTLGGSIAHADPAAELAAVSLVLNARFRLRSQSAERWVPAGEFFVGLFMTVLEPEELLVEIALPPMPERSGWSFMEVTRRHHDFAMAGIAAMVTLDDAGRCSEARIAFLSVGDGPVDARQASAALEGQEVTEEAILSAAEIAASADVDPGNDIHASAEYRRHLARVLAVRALTQAVQRASES